MMVSPDKLIDRPEIGLMPSVAVFQSLLVCETAPG